MTRTERTQVRRWLKSALKDLEAARRTIALDLKSPAPAVAIADVEALIVCENTIGRIRGKIQP